MWEPGNQMIYAGAPSLIGFRVLAVLVVLLCFVFKFGAPALIGSRIWEVLLLLRFLFVCVCLC